MILPTVAVLLLSTTTDVSGVSAQPPPAALAPEAAAAPRPERESAGSVSRIDALHRRRDDKSAFAEELKLLETGITHAPRDYQLLWRAARAYFWLSDDPAIPREEKSRFGKIGWDLAERAIAVDGSQPDGHYWAAVDMGSYAVGLGLVKALALNLEGKFRERLGRAAELAPGYEFGAIDVVWGRFYELLPWPKRDRKEAEAHLRRVLTSINPGNLRARVFLAQTLAAEDRAREAKVLLDQVAAAQPGAYDAPEERRAKALGDAVMPEIAKAATR